MYFTTKFLVNSKSAITYSTAVDSIPFFTDYGWLGTFYLIRTNRFVLMRTTGFVCLQFDIESAYMGDLAGCTIPFKILQALSSHNSATVNSGWCKHKKNRIKTGKTGKRHDTVLLMLA